MRAPPPLNWPTPPRAAWRRGLTAFAGLVCAVQLSWLGTHGLDADAADLPRLLTWSAVLLLPCVWLFRALPRLAEPPGEHLVWTGRHWLWGPREDRTPTPPAGRLELLLDADDWLLVRWRIGTDTVFPARGRWALLARSDAPDLWPRLRRTVLTAWPHPVAADEH